MVINDFLHTDNTEIDDVAHLLLRRDLTLVLPLISGLDIIYFQSPRVRTVSVYCLEPLVSYKHYSID